MGLQWWTWAPSCTHPQLQLGPHSSPFRLSPCSQSIFSLGLSSESQASAPSTPHTPADMCLRLGSAGRRPDPLCWSFSVLPAANWLLHSPPSLWSSLSVLPDIPTSESASQCEGTFPLSQLPPRAQVPPQFHFFFFPPTQLCGDLFCNFGFMRFSASIQQVFWENCSTCKCIFDVFVGGGELPIFLFHHLDQAPLVLFLILEGKYSLFHH